MNTSYDSVQHKTFIYNLSFRGEVFKLTTIVNTPNTGGETGNNTGAMLMVLVLIAFLFAALYFGLPYLRRATAVPQVNIPDQIDVNVNTPQE